MKVVHHILNGLLCKFHKHGASCAIDVLIELYFYCLYDKFVSTERDGSLVKELELVCKIRVEKGRLDCQSRESVWDWLVNAFPLQYSPKGRGDAETIAGFQALVKALPMLFDTHFEAQINCVQCNKWDLPTSPITGPISVSQYSLRKGSNILQASIEAQLETMAKVSNEVYCQNCNCEQHFTDCWMMLPEYLLIENCTVHRGKNTKKLEINEDTDIFGNRYELLGAVVMNPGHFMTIVKNNGEFMFLDDMREDIVRYPTFAGAITRNKSSTSRKHITSLWENAVHLLLFQHTQGNRKLPYEMQHRSIRTAFGRKGWYAKINPTSNSNGKGSQTSTSHSIMPQQVHNIRSLSTVSTVSNRGASVPLLTGTNVPNMTIPSQSTKFSPNKGMSSVKSMSTLNATPKKVMSSVKCIPPSKATPEKELSSMKSMHSPKATPKKIVSSVKSMPSRGATHKEMSSVTSTPSPKEKHKEEMSSENSTSSPKAKPKEEMSSVKSTSSSKATLKKGISSVKCTPSPRSPKGQWHVSTPRHQPSAPTGQSQSSICNSPSGVWSITPTKDLQKQQKTQPIKKKGTIIVAGKSVEFVIVQTNQMFLSCRDIWSVMGLWSHVRNRGYGKIDKLLEGAGMKKDDVYVFRAKTRREYVKIDAVLHIVDTGWPNARGSVKHAFQSMGKQVKESLISILHERAVLGLDVRRRLAFGRKDQQKSPSRLQIQRRKRQRQRTPVAIARAVLKNLYTLKFNDDRSLMMHSLSKLFRPQRKQNNSNFTGYFSPEDVCMMLTGAPSRYKKYKNMLEEIAVQGIQPMSPEDLVNILENYSGRRLADQLRKKVHCIPSSRSHANSQKLYCTEFEAVLLPRRTSTGWEINISRLIETLLIRYHWLKNTRHWRVYGDGREIGGRHSVFMAINILNNEAALHGMLFQSPKNIYPTSIFYESDSRDNLEENLGFPESRLNREISKLQQTGEHVFSLAGDEMFLEAILDGENSLGPTSNEGWNIYHKSNKTQKGVVGSSGFRTDLNVGIDRIHPTSLLPSIPLTSTVFCILHGQARVVESLLELVLSDIAAEGNRLQQQGSSSSDGYRLAKIATLENNINQRGVRQGNFQFHFTKQGNPDKISLNKDHAYAILCPSCDNGSMKFNHVLHNVLSTSRVVRSVLPSVVRQKLGLQDEYNMFELVSTVWNHFFEMIEILRKDPTPLLKDDSKIGSTDPDDYVWGYSDEDLTQYKLHAECFFQLFVMKYNTNSDLPGGKLTPYMIKFIDHAPVLMRSLPFPLSRYQAEGGEHKNYMDSRYYFQHTTRHGGNNKCDVILAMFKNMWKVLSYEITNSGTKGGPVACEAADKFRNLTKQHVAASIIQRNFKGWLVRKTLQEHQLWTPLDPWTKTLSQLQWDRNREIVRNLGAATCDKEIEGLIFKREIFVLRDKPTGKMTQQDVVSMIRKNGGRVRKSLPGTKKGVSTKQYVVLTNHINGRAMQTVRQAVQGNHRVLRYNFVTDSVDKQKLQNYDAYSHDLSSIAASITRKLPLHKKHFSRSYSTVAGFIKKKRKQLRTKKNASSRQQKSEHVGNSACNFYASQQLRLTKVQGRLQSLKALNSFKKQWKALPREEQHRIEKEWKSKKSGMGN